MFARISSKKGKRVIKYCDDVRDRSLPDAVLKNLRMRSLHWFLMYGIAFELSFDWRADMWRLTLAPVDQPPRRRPPGGPDGRVRRGARVPARAARARPQRRAVLKRLLLARICFLLYIKAARCSAGAILPRLLAMVSTMRMAFARLVELSQARIRSLRVQNAANPMPVARLEPRLCGESLPMVLHTFVQNRGLWEGWPFGMPQGMEFAAA